MGQIAGMSPSLAVILLNYKRPQNLGAITSAARQALPDAAIYVLDQAEREEMRWRDETPANGV